MIKARLSQRNRPPNKGGVKGKVCVHIIQCGRNALLGLGVKAGVLAQPGQHALLPKVKKQRTHFGVDDGKLCGPSAVSALPSEGQPQTPSRCEHPAHFVKGLPRLGHVHQTESAQRNVKAGIL